MTVRLIDLDKVKPMDFPSYEMDGLDVVRYLETLPTVDAAPVAHGRWEILDFAGYMRCSVCGQIMDGYYNYCPHCGAKMDGDKND